MLVPDRGNVVMVDDFECVVLSHEKYNRVTGLMLVCPVTDEVKGYPFEIIVEDRGWQKAILSDQVNNISYEGKKIRVVDHVNDEIVKLCIDKIKKIML